MNAVAQMELRYRPRTVGENAWSEHLAAIASAVAFLTPKEVTFELGIKDSYLSAALRPPSNEESDEQRKYWRSPWTLILLAMLGERYTDVADQHAAAILRTQAVLTRFVVEDRVELTDAEVIARLARDPKRKAEIEEIRRGKR